MFLLQIHHLKKIKNKKLQKNNFLYNKIKIIKHKITIKIHKCQENLIKIICFSKILMFFV